jgi:hypothetical protein
VSEMVRGSRKEIGVIELRVFICRRRIYSDILELTSLFDTNRENELDEYVITTFTLPKL